ncbi:threonine ammonia-lyase [Elongatibacter sediminis]|uniref:Threonine/serine dehydratase n=1 Tax=Elongatibacter sediminis TaxID=3119006 RepID=A0AAW9RMZ6_9GAMM
MPQSKDSGDLPDFADVQLAAARIRDRVRETPVIHEPELDDAFGCQLFFKCENLQRTGAFKFRGASHALARLAEDGITGDVATHSSGNHGAALALAARLEGRCAHVVMPENASRVKIEAVRRYGGEIHFCAPTQAAREEGLASRVESGAIAVPPYDHPDIIAGQGTACLELLQRIPDLDSVLAPIGGGGLISGTALVARERGLTVFGAEPAGADDTARSLELGRRVASSQPDTIADGLRALVGVRNFTLIQRHVKQVITVSENEIREAMAVAWRHLRLLIEPSSAVVIAALRSSADTFAGRRVGVILSGANISPADWLALTANPAGSHEAHDAAT